MHWLRICSDWVETFGQTAREVHPVLRDVLSSIESGVLAEVGLLAFLFAFVLVLVRVLWMSRAELDEGRFSPLRDPEELPSNGASQ